MSAPMIALLLAIVLTLAVWGIWDYGRGLDERMAMASRGRRGFEERRMTTSLDRLDMWLRRQPLGRQLSRRITAAGLRTRPSLFLVTIVGGGLVVIVVVSQIVSLFLGVLAALGVGGAGLAYLRKQEGRRREEFIDQLPELARVLSNATAAGLSVRTALEMAADELDEPARTELARTAEALRIGQSFEDAMTDLQKRLPSRELAVLVSTLVVSARAGGSLITALRNISTTLEQRKETRREVKTIVGQAVVAGYAVAGMTICLVVGMSVFSPKAFGEMTGSFIGQAIVLTAFGLFIGATLLIRKVTRIDV
ncbi:type II secretion system F family protein [Actinomadura alba]|uniref:Type II secretion system F family protein n=1 Tax=Actinomadura alba TaxID=406431 RepID=A0ABR7LQP0_9ACTN|nr:type II secretion system F family protein [Actinomadura alba]MBC6467070.1 type II secretion system F family protein [Actinomadura alba]